jgi:O-antigen/teichoic acid export membrane protein
MQVTSSEQLAAAEDQASSEESAAIGGLFGRDMIYLAFWGLQIVLAAALTPATTRLMPQSAFGQVAACIAVCQLLTTLFSFSLYTAVQRAYSREGGEDHARYLVALAVALSLLVGSFTYATGRWWCPLIGLGPFPVAVRYAVLWAIMSAVTGPALGLLRSKDHLRAFIAASFTQALFAQALALGLVIFVRATAAEYILGQLIGEAATAAIALWVAPPKIPSRAHAPMLAEAFRFSSALVPAGIASFLLDASDRIVIHADLGPKPLSHYAVARNIGGFALILLQLVGLVWMPRLFAIKDVITRRNVLATSRDGLYILVVSFVVAIAAASPLILRLWAPPSYNPTSLLLITALIAAAALPAADTMIYTQVLILNNRTKAVAVAAIGMAALNLVLNLALVPTLGIDGSAGITFCCYAAGAMRSRWMAGDTGPPVNARALVISMAGIGVCIASAAVPATGVALGLRMVVAAMAACAFLAQVVALSRPATYRRLRGQLGRIGLRISDS